MGIISLFVRGAHGEIPPITITDNTEPTIAQLYRQYKSNQDALTGIKSEHSDALYENFEAMRDKRDSLANKTLNTLTTAATAGGGYAAISALSEQRIDKESEQDMGAYLSTMRCEYSGGTNVQAGNTDIEIPGGNELLAYYTEYKQLAEKLKQTKAALNLPAGLESQTIYDKSETNLYKYASVGRGTGANISIARALSDANSADATAWTAQKEENAKNLKQGTIAAVGGVAAGIIGNKLINKDAPKENSAEINREYNKKIEKIEQENKDLENQLTQAIASNKSRMDEYNETLKQHQELVKAISVNCRDEFRSYINQVTALEQLTNETDSVPELDLPEISDQQSKSEECKCKMQGGTWQTDKCEQTTLTPKESTVLPSNTPVLKNRDICPRTGNKLSILNSQTVGTKCTTNLIIDGTITKTNNGTCTCVAKTCANGYQVSGGQCIKTQTPSTKKQETTTTSTGSTEETYVDANGYCTPHTLEWTFDKNNYSKGITNADISNYFNQQCNSHAKTHNCVRTDLNTSKKIDEDDRFITYQWTCNASSEDYLAQQARIEARYNNLSYSNICTESGITKNKEITSTVDKKTIHKYCLTGFETISSIPDYKTESELAKAFVAEKQGARIVCSDKREPITKSDKTVGYYINCNSTDDSLRYTFKFATQSLASQAVQSTIDTIRNREESDIEWTSPTNLMEAICYIYGVKYGQKDIGRSMYQPYCSYRHSGTNDATCKKIDALAQKFGYHARIVSGLGCALDSTNGLGQDINNQNNKTGLISDSGKLDHTKLRTAFGLDNYMFSNISTNADTWLLAQIRVIVENEMKKAGHQDPLVSFECELPGSYFQLDEVSVLTCRANNRDIDFVFKQLNDVSSRRAKAADEGLTCIFESGGRYDGRKCWGLKPEQCTELGQKIKEKASNCPQCGTKWLDEPAPGVCSLTKSTKVEKTDVGVKLAINGAILTGATVATIFTDGAAAGILVAVGTEMVGFVAEVITSTQMRNKANEFLAATQYCKDATCASEVLDSDKVAEIMQLESNLTYAQAQTIDAEVARLLTLLPEDDPVFVAILAETEEKPNCNFWNKLTAGCTTTQLINAWAQVAQFATLFYSGVKIAAHIARTKTVLVEGAEKLARKMTRADAKALDDINKNITRYQKQLKQLSGKDPQKARQLQSNIIREQDKQNRILNKFGTKNATEVKQAQQAAFHEQAIKDANEDYQKLLAERDKWLKLEHSHGRNPDRFELQNWDKRVADTEQKLRDLGQEVTPAEPLFKSGTQQTGKQATTKKAETPAKPNEPTGKVKSADDASRTLVAKPVKSKSEKIAEARQRGDLGYHGTDANIATDDMIRPSSNTANLQGKVKYGYGIAKDYDAAERYAVRRVIERQNVGKDLDFALDTKTNVLVITNNSTTPLNLSNKTGYVYTTAKDSDMAWEVLRNGYASDYAKGFEAAQMPNAVEILDKKAFNLDDLIRQGKVKIVEPKLD